MGRQSGSFPSIEPKTRSELEEQHKELRSLMDRYEMIRAMPCGPARDRAMEQWSNNVSKYFERTKTKPK
jgi:hypothetical protein